MVAIVHSSAPFGGVIGTLIAKFSDTFYSDPRRLSAVITLLLAPMAGIALFTVIAVAVDWLRRLADRGGSRRAGVWFAATTARPAAVSIGYGWRYFRGIAT